jgi:hypothetical protein
VPAVLYEVDKPVRFKRPIRQVVWANMRWIGAVSLFLGIGCIPKDANHGDFGPALFYGGMGLLILIVRFWVVPLCLAGLAGVLAILAAGFSHGLLAGMVTIITMIIVGRSMATSFRDAYYAHKAAHIFDLVPIRKR